MNDYNVLAKFLTDKYIDRVSGRDFPERIVGEDPEKVVMAGTMAEDRNEETFEGGYREDLSKQFESIPSISLSFHIDKKSEGSMRIIPRGLLFYTVLPTYEEVKDYIIRIQSERDHYVYKSIEELKEKYPDIHYQLPQVYKKVAIEDVLKDGIEISLADLTCGKSHLEALINDQLNIIADQIVDEIRIVPDADLYFSDLLDKDRFELKCVAKPEKINAHWNVDIYQIISEEDGDYYFTFQMVNKTAKPDRQNLGYLPKIYDAGMTIIADNGIKFKEIPMRYFKTGFKKKDPVYAVAENVSVKFDVDENALRTVNIPRYYQMRTITNDKYSDYTKFSALIEDPVKNLKYILSELKKDYQICYDEFDNAERLSDVARDNYRDALSDYETEIARFEDGIQQIEYTDWVKRAFVLMNKTFQTKLDSNTHPIEGWRLFQIVFIVSMICEVIRSEYKDDPDPALKKADNDIANLLYFPTGGGKTEAFLGITVFSMFFDRVRGKEEGVTAILKYPLRLLAVQQLERVLTVVMKANIVRKLDTQLRDTNAFSLEELKEKLYDYWIELVYNKVKNDVNNLYNAFQNQANNYLEDKGIPKYYPESMTSDTDFQSVRKTLFEIQENRKNLESKNLLLATSTIVKNTALMMCIYVPCLSCSKVEKKPFQSGKIMNRLCIKHYPSIRRMDITVLFKLPIVTRVHFFVMVLA